MGNPIDQPAYQELLHNWKETMSCITDIDGDGITWDIAKARHFQEDLAKTLTELLSVQEFRKIDDAYMVAQNAETAVTEFENTPPTTDDEDARIYSELEGVASIAWDHFKEVLAQVLNRPIPTE